MHSGGKGLVMAQTMYERTMGDNYLARSTQHMIRVGIALCLLYLTNIKLDVMIG